MEWLAHPPLVGWGCDSDNAVLLTHLDVSDFFEDLSGKIDHLMSNDNV